MEQPVKRPVTSLGKWYCLKCQPRMEILATENLKHLPGLEVFFPQTIDLKKKGDRQQQIKRPLFPGYIFASFDPVDSMRAVHYAQGVAYVVKHGLEPVEIHPTIIEELKSVTLEDFLTMPNRKPIIGESVRILHKLFDGREATIEKLLPEKKRVQVLLEILGAHCRVVIKEELVDAGTAHPLQTSS